MKFKSSSFDFTSVLFKCNLMVWGVCLQVVRANPEVFDAEESEVESVMGSSAESFDGWQEFDEEWASIVDLEALQQTYMQQ